MRRKSFFNWDLQGFKTFEGLEKKTDTNVNPVPGVIRTENR